MAKARRRLKVKLPPLTRDGVLASLEEIADKIDSAADDVPGEGADRPDVIARDIETEVQGVRDYLRAVESSGTFDLDEIADAIETVEDKVGDLRILAEDLDRATTALEEQLTRARALAKRIDREGSPWSEEVAS